MSYYKVFDSDFLEIVPNNDMLVTALKKTSDNSFEITGETTPYSDYMDITWSSKDNINHGYLKHNTDTNFEGKVLRFSVGDSENTSDYTDNKIVQHFKIKPVNKEEKKVNILSFGVPVKGSVVVNRSSTIDLKVPYIIGGSVILTYSTDTGIVTGKEGEDFSVNCERGYITLLSTNIPFNSKLSIKFDYCDGINFKIDFNKIGIDVSNIEKFSIPLKLKRGVGEGKKFKFSLCEVETEMGEVSPIPSNLKLQNIGLCEDFRYVRNYSSELVVKTIDKLGFRRELIINIGDGDYLDITGADIIFNRFNTGFKDWYTQICKRAKEKGMTNIKVVIPLENKYMKKDCFQKTKGGRYLKYLNPTHPMVVELMKSIVSQLMDMTVDLTLSIAFENFSYLMDGKGNIGVFDSHTKERFEIENPDSLYLGKGNIKEFDKITVESDLKTAKWLADRLQLAFSKISKVKKSDVIIEDFLLFTDNFLSCINAIDMTWTPLFNKVIVRHSKWEDESFNYIERINIIKDKFGVDYTKVAYFIFLDDYYLNRSTSRFSYYKKVMKALDVLENEIGLDDIIISTGHSVRGDSILFYKIVPYVELNKVDHKLDIALCRANKETLCYLPDTMVTNLTRVVDDVDQISLEIPYNIVDRFEHKVVKNYFYDDIKPERVLRINEKEIFVIKSVEEVIEERVYKTVTALSLEHKLSKRTVVLDEVIMQLYSEPNSGDDMCGIFNLLEDETGWTVGYIDTEVQFEIVDGVQKAKARWFETIDQSWYTFLRDTVSTSFDCLIQFDTLNKRVNVFKNTYVGDDRGLYLTEDNYIKSLAITDTTNEIVTRLTCIGKDEMGIHAVNITGQGYIDDFSYFIENGDVSPQLVVALDKYDKAMERLNQQWELLSTSRFNKNKTLQEYKKEHKTIVGEINALKAIKESYEQAGNQAEANRVQGEIDEKVVKKLSLESKMTQLEQEIKILDADMNKVSIQLNPVNTVDEQGVKIFNKQLLDERQEFIYSDVWVDDTYLDEKVLYDSGKQQLSLMCKPTTDYSIDVVNFLERIGKKKGFNGELFLRDVIILKTNVHNQEIELYLVGYEYSPKDKTLQLTLSNKFKTSNGTKLLGDLLSESKRISRTVKLKKHLWQKAKEMV